MLDQTNLTKSGLPLTVRSVFVIDNPYKIVRLILTYPASCGRNFNEILRCIDSLMVTDKNQVATPADWNKGDPLLVAPSVTTEDAKKKYGEVHEVKPYYRIVQYNQVVKD